MRIKVLNSIDARGTLTFTPEDPPRPQGKYVFQNTRPGHGNVASDPTRRLQLRVHVIPFDPQTAAQVARRDLFRNAVQEWHALSPEERDAYKAAAGKSRTTAFNVYISQRLRNP